MLCIFSKFTFVQRDGYKYCHLHLVAEMIMHKDFPILSERIVVIVDGAATECARLLGKAAYLTSSSFMVRTHPMMLVTFSIVIVLGF